ncbi:MAG: acetyl-CoA carboxylase biotin carboxyl carrier protein [Pseudomonadota bacterium]
MAQKNSFDAEIVRQLAQLLDETDLNEIEYEANDCRVRVVRHARTTEVVVPDAPVASPALVQPEATVTEFAPKAVALAPTDADHPGAIKSPMVGNAYMAPEPEAEPFVREGDTVEAGQTLLIIEAMKVMNPIKAPTGGKVIKILVKDGDPVEFDEVLLIVG